MKILIVAPFKDSFVRGNFVTADRWCRGLTLRGFNVVLSSPENLEKSAARPDIVHAHHAVHCGQAALTFSQKHQIPLVISIGGTDLNSTENGQPDLRCIKPLNNANAIITPFKEMGAKLDYFIKMPHHYIVRRGVAVPDITLSHRRHGLSGLVVGGLRPVKGQLKALHWAEALRQKAMPVHLKLVGPIIDPDYAKRIQQQLQQQPEDEWVGAVDHNQMHHLYTKANFLLNTSKYEGASNAILEALAHGCPVAAIRCPGNEEMLGSAPHDIACLFDDQDSGLQKLSAWLENLAHQSVEKRNLIAYHTRHHVMVNHNADDEIEELINVYHGLLLEKRPFSRDVFIQSPIVP